MLYAAGMPACAMVETIVRDRFAHRVSLRLPRVEIEQCSLVSLRGAAPPRLLDLHGGGASRIGCAGVVLGDPRHAAGRALAAWVHREMENLDGLLYPSRFTQGTCVAIFERAVTRPRVVDVAAFMLDPVAGRVPDSYRVELLG